MLAETYDNLIAQALAGHVNTGTDTFKMGLLTGYTPNLVTDVHWSDISAHEITGTNYVAGGATVSGLTVTVTAANSWTHTWAAAQPYTYGQVIAPATPNAFLYRCAQAGTSGGSAPTFPTTIDGEVTDGGAIWICAGRAITVITSSAITWALASFSATACALYDFTTGVLVSTTNFGAVEAPVAQDFTLNPDPILGLANWISA